MFKELGWDSLKMKILIEKVQQRVLKPGEILFEDGMPADYLYFLVQGELKLEKEVQIDNYGFHPLDSQKWRQEQSN